MLLESCAEAAEQRDKEGRRNNTVVPETDASRAEDRNKADVSFRLQLFNVLTTLCVFYISEAFLCFIFRQWCE